MKQYLDLCRRIIKDGADIKNHRTKKICRTVINANMVYKDVSTNFPILTTKKVAWRPAIAEMLGYLRGYSSAAQFREIGCKTWDANANDNEAWLQNPNRKGEDDMGRAYGPQLRDWRRPDGKSVDQLRSVYQDLRDGIDNRSEILTFLNPGERHLSCLNACMHTHTFSLVSGVLHLTSNQRSDDVPLGHAFNMVQVGWLLLVMAKITNKKPGNCYHNIVNAHIYEDQLSTVKGTQIYRIPYDPPRMIMHEGIKTLDDLMDWVTVDDFDLINYNHHPTIKYEFSV